MSDTTYPPIASVNAPNVGTKQAAFYLGREQTTLRIWACKGTGPVTPIRVNGRLAWPVTKIREAVGA